MNLNKVFLLGNLTRDVNLRNTPSGKSVADFGLATNRVWLDQSGQKQQEAEFHNIVVWGRMAELCSQYLSKGRLVFIEGRLRTRNWQDANGQKRTKTEVIAENIQFGPWPASSFKKEDLEIPATEKIPEVSYDEISIPEEKTNFSEVDTEEIPF